MATQGLFTDIYQKFTGWFTEVQVDQKESRIHVPEKTLRCVWNDQLFRAENLKTTDNQELEIVFPGHWNFGPGPDFKNAAVKVSGKLLEGDIALHVYASDWTAQDQSGNPDYTNVILHVFMWENPHGQPSGKRPGNRVHELELKRFLTRGILELNHEVDFDHYPLLHQPDYGLCHQPLARLSKEKLTHLLNAAGDARIFTKMNRFHDRVIINGYEQTFYEGVAEALGYPNNKEAFQILSGTLPLYLIQNLVPPGIGEAEKALHIQAMMFGAAGLIEFKGLDTKALHPEDRSYFGTLQSLWDTYRSQVPPSRLIASSWKFGGIRPANFPYRRIAGLAHLLVRHEANGLFADYMTAFKNVIAQAAQKGDAAKIPGPMYDFFCVETDDYWAHHYSPAGKTLSSAQQLIGPARSKEITINMVIPIGLIYARASKSTALEAGLNALFQSGRKPGDNRLLRFMKHYIFGNKPEMLKALASEKQMQGLMQVYQDFCTQNKNNCLHCQFPGIVKKNFT